MKGDGSGTFGRWGGFLVFAIMVIAFIHRETLGIQLLGLVEVIVGLSLVRSQSVGYGIRGRPARGYIRGFPAILLGVGLSLLGLYSLLRPAAVAAWGHRH